MRSYFRPMVSSFIERGGTYRTHERLTQIQTTDSGFRLSFVNQKTNELKIFEAHRAVLLNLTVWDVVNGLIPDNDPLRTSSVFKRWQRSALAEKGWGAFAIYAIADDQSAWPALPHYHQIFPHPDDPSELKSSLYVSIPARDDPSQPKGMRTLTATIHIPCGDISAEQRQQWTTSLVQRIENSLMTKLTHIETAQPATFAHYTGRRLGQVGGFPLRLRNFLFFSVPSRISHPTLKNCQLLLMGDTVFPGQGVVACSVSGIAAFERATELSFEKIKDSSINFRKTT
jgi:phytoene dehydrogenase-like protein